MIKSVLSLIISIFEGILLMVICYFIGWLLGVILNFTPLSESINDGLNLIFDTDRFARHNFPNLLGTLLFFAAFFYKGKD